jgi:CRP/FNR family transcriptional regulator, cyclic AMP receptor protein
LQHSYIAPSGITIEDPLAHLPVSGIAEYHKGAVVYGPEKPPASLYVVLAGKVKLCRTAPGGLQVVLDVYQTDEFFGESSLVGGSPDESAVALENTRVMSWTATEIQDIVTRRPDLGLALLQLAVLRSVDFGKRIESFSLDNIERRLVSALIRFAHRLGAPVEDGGREMIAFTHELLSQHVGTSREIVTHYMNYFRRRGALRYSRKSIVVFEDALRALADHAISVAA